MSDARSADHPTGRQLRSGIIIGYWNEAELPTERDRLGIR
jgi:hypothetical protein